MPAVSKYNYLSLLVCLYFTLLTTNALSQSTTISPAIVNLQTTAINQSAIINQAISANQSIRQTSTLDAATSSKLLVESSSLINDNEKFNHDDPVLVITSTKEEKLKSELPEAIHVIDKLEIEEVSPTHPAEILNRIPGVHINNLGGEGHMSSIRQPLTTAGVYLFLEDGIPTRPTGFFNHNGLYEINLPQSSRIEVIKGTGSALYGSDSIGGIINAITTPAPDNLQASVHLENGSNEWQRGLLSIGNAIADNLQFRADINLTDNEGFRDESAYQRQSTTLRFDTNLINKWQFKTIFAYSKIEQSGVSTLEQTDYKNHPEKNLYHGDIGFRDVEAIRLSSEINYHQNDKTLWTVTPYFRDNQMTMMPSWMISYDPNIRQYDFQSYGGMLKARHFFSSDFTLIAGIDAETTPSTYQESAITLLHQTEMLTDYQFTEEQFYHFKATQDLISAYLHTEWKISPDWLINIGARYDYFSVDYNDRLDHQAINSAHIRPESQKLDFNQLSPKFGLVYWIDEDQQLYFNHRYAFVAPSVGSLFRPGSSLASTELQPVIAKNIELGYRSHLAEEWQLELAIYQLNKKDDIINFIDGTDRKVTNAGETSHKGIELGLQGSLSDSFLFSIGWTRTWQKYEEYNYIYQCYSPQCGRQIPGPPIKENRNFSGYYIGKAPETLANINLQYYPSFWQGFRFSLEMEQVGKYFTDETNTQKYPGHEIYHFRSSFEVNENLKVLFRIMNFTDKSYSTYTSNQVGDSDIAYRPGNPRSFYLGLKYHHE
ncbi:TonB-dependent receptor [Aliikangiella maris]|uniref:TonB-dependent receptor n=2 Tax=Aliikangiella maris TaxID=3162458 RepID=A0ABV3MLT5_9GAMM